MTVGANTAAVTSAATATGSAAVIGAGPAGLLTAIMLAQRGWPQVAVYDARSAPPAPDDPAWGAGKRSYQIGLNGRGQSALRRFGALDRVSAYSASVNGRLGFDPRGAPTESRFKPPGTKGAEKTYVTRVLQRDRLQACLLEEVKAKYPAISVNFGVACDGVDLRQERPVVELCTAAVSSSNEAEQEGCAVETDASARRMPFDLVVGADGVRSAVRESLEATSSTSTVRFVDDNERQYKTLPLSPSLVDGTAADLNWGYRNRTLDLGVDALPTKEGEMVAVLLFKPGTPVFETIDSLRTADDARAFLAESLPPLLPYVREEELARFVSRPIGKLPSFQLVEGDLHASTPRGAVVLLGDAIKAVKPYFGQGANSALEDVSVLERCLSETNDQPAASAAAFTDARADDARALVRMSRSFDHPGPLGTARFLVPLLLDIQLNKLLPAVFTPPLLRGLQSEATTFVGLLRRKQRERALLLGALLATLATTRPLLMAQLAYVAAGLGVGVGAAKVAKFAREGGSLIALVAVPLQWMQGQLRAMLLRMDPSLAEEEGATIGWKDLKRGTPRLRPAGGGVLKNPLKNPFDRQNQKRVD